MVTIHFDEVQLRQRLLGYTATAIYLLSVGLYLIGIIPLEIHGASLISALALIVVVLALPPLHPASCIRISDRSIRIRMGMFKRASMKWSDIRHIEMHSTHFIVYLRKGQPVEIPLYFLPYIEALKLRQFSKQKAYRNGVSVRDFELA